MNDTEVIGLADVPLEDLKKVLAALFEHLHIELTQEKTPDGTHYEVVNSVMKIRY